MPTAPTTLLPPPTGGGVACPWCLRPAGRCKPECPLRPGPVPSAAMTTDDPTPPPVLRGPADALDNVRAVDAADVQIAPAHATPAHGAVPGFPPVETVAGVYGATAGAPSTPPLRRPTGPRLGQVVIYTSKIDNGEGNVVRSPAIVIRTRSTCVPAVIDRWGQDPQPVEAVDGTTVTPFRRPDGVVAMLPDDETVDLLVHGLGGDYREYTVARGTGLGEWEWPTRA